MTAITELQQRFQDAILTKDPDPGLFVSQGSKTGFSIYANAYRARLTDALRDNYPVLSLALGDESFARLALAYIAARPSRFRSIRWFGEGLAGFMARRPDLVPHPALVDLAKMDWALREAFDAGNDEMLQVGDLAAVLPEAWPALCFRLRAAVRLTSLSWRVEPIWHALSENENAQTVPPEPHDHTLLVWRQELDCRWRSLEPAETAGVRALAAGTSFAGICECVAAVDDAASATSTALMLRRWVEDGLLLKQND